MILFAIVVFVSAIVIGGFWLLARREDIWPTTGMAALGVLLLSLVILLCSCVTSIKSGHVGVMTIFGNVKNQHLDSGLHFVNPLCHVEQMSVRTENYWMSHIDHEGSKKGDDSISVRSSNGLSLSVDCSVPYRLLPEAAPWVYKNLGKDYVEKIIRVALSTAARRAAAGFTAEELYSTKRDVFAEKIRVLVNEELHNMLQENYAGSAPEKVVVVSQVLVGHVDIPAMVKTAIENKLKADQEQQAMTFRILKEKQEAERKKIEATGIHDFQNIVSKGITPGLLQWKALDVTHDLAKSPNTKVIIIGAGKSGLPVLLGNSLDAFDKK